MCGIIGSFPGCEIKLDYLLHRGPDGSGIIVQPDISMGHTRLAILDLSDRALQPKWSSDLNVLISYNGEIYNFKDLTLHEKKSDTVALLEWLSKQGPSFNPAYLDGMYAFAAYFNSLQYLLLCRDPAGIKPLYIAISPEDEYIAFSSEIKGFFGIPWFSPEPNLDREIQREFIQYGYSFPRDVAIYFNGFRSVLPLIPTLIRNVFQVCPGQKIIISLKEKIRSSFTDLTTVDQNTNVNYQDPVAILNKSIISQSISDVDVGIQYSGGIDSTLIAYYYLKKFNAVDAFYISIQESATNEDKWALEGVKTLKKFGDINFHKIDVNEQDILRVLPSVAWFMDEPVMRHPNAIGIYLLAEYVKQKTDVKVLLNGQGADEKFGGYWDITGKNFTKFDKGRRLYDLGGSDHVTYFLEENGNKSILEQQLLFNENFYLPPLLARDDRMNMAHSLEARVPFLSNNFLAMPKIQKPGKIAFKEDIAKIFGVKYANRTKVGFGFPWPWLSDIDAPTESLEWLADKYNPEKPSERWTISSLAFWSKFYLYDGWKMMSGKKPKNFTIQNIG